MTDHYYRLELFKRFSEDFKPGTGIIVLEEMLKSLDDPTPAALHDLKRTYRACAMPGGVA